MVFCSVNFTLLISDYQFFTPPLKRKADGISESHVLPFAGKNVVAFFSGCWCHLFVCSFYLLFSVAFLIPHTNQKIKVRNLETVVICPDIELTYF